jgi:NAD(P)-dependent dehydrogenase (short-subunit alcohol dehydrogenase family)
VGGQCEADPAGSTGDGGEAFADGGGEGRFPCGAPAAENRVAQIFAQDQEHDLANGLRMLHLAIDTHLITAHFALPLLIQRPGGLLVEVTDGTADYNATHYRLSPFYDLSKVAVNRMAWAHAKDLAKHAATSLSLTPGWLRSEMMLDLFGVTEENWRDATTAQPHFAISETPRFVGRAVAALAADPDRHRWNGQSLSSGGLAKEYGFTDLDGSRPDAWRYIVEVVHAGKPADTTGYR